MSSICNILRSAVQEADQGFALTAHVLRHDFVPFLLESGERYLVVGVLATPVVIAPLVFGWGEKEGKGTDLAEVISDVATIWSVVLGMYALAKVRELHLEWEVLGFPIGAPLRVLLSVGG